uniref:Immunoglobulin V-set domain-containing protein n=1 Tax=Pygocentrus nattereri TaxID=42514 RepID=A0A3B4CVW3_PYGNA
LLQPCFKKHLLSSTGATERFQSINFISIFIVSGATEDRQQRAYRVGDTVHLELRQNISASEMDDVQWKFNNQIISKKRNITHQNKEKYRIFRNGALQIHDGRKTGSGNYSVIIYNRTGHHITEEETLLTFLGHS